MTGWDKLVCFLENCIADLSTWDCEQIAADRKITNETSECHV